MKFEEKSAASSDVLKLSEMKEETIFQNKKVIASISGVLLLLVAGGSFILLEQDGKAEVNNVPAQVLEKKEEKQNDPVEPQKEEVKTIKNPLNGVEIDKEKFVSLSHRPLAVMIDNSKEGRANQKGVNRADVIYEAIVEGGWTRLMPIYFSDQSDFLVMPTRSVRMVFLDQLAEYNDMFIYHVGGAQTPANKKTDAVGRIYSEKIKSLFFIPDKSDRNKDWTLYPQFDAACEKKGYPDYNCKFQSTAKIFAKATEAGYESTKWEPENKFEWAWKFDSEKYTKSEVTAQSIKYKFTNNAGFNADWTYDATKDQYLRSTGGQKHMDNADNTQLWANTIIVQRIPYKLNVDDKLRNIATTEGKGEGQIFMKGKVYEVTWKKDCAKCRTRYFEKVSGEEFVFAPGKIWVSVNRVEEKTTYK